MRDWSVFGKSLTERLAWLPSGHSSLPSLHLSPVNNKLWAEEVRRDSLKLSLLEKRVCIASNLSRWLLRCDGCAGPGLRVLHSSASSYIEAFSSADQSAIYNILNSIQSVADAAPVTTAAGQAYANAQSYTSSGQPSTGTGYATAFGKAMAQAARQDPHSIASMLNQCTQGEHQSLRMQSITDTPKGALG